MEERILLESQTDKKTPGTRNHQRHILAGNLYIELIRHFNDFRQEPSGALGGIIRLESPYRIQTSEMINFYSNDDPRTLSFATAFCITDREDPELKLKYKESCFAISIDDKTEFHRLLKEKRLPYYTVENFADDVPAETTDSGRAEGTETKHDKRRYKKPNEEGEKIARREERIRAKIYSGGRISEQEPSDEKLVRELLYRPGKRSRRKITPSN
jgi:hypothetical protein